MKALFFSLSLFVGVAGSQAKDAVSLIREVSVQCEQEGVKLSFSEKLKTVWQSDPGQSEGIELKNVEFKVKEGPIAGLYDVSGDLVFESDGLVPIEEKVRLRYTTDAFQNSDGSWRIEASVFELNATEATLSQIPCKKL